MVQRGIRGNGRVGLECGMSERGRGWKVCCCVQPGSRHARYRLYQQSGGLRDRRGSPGSPIHNQ